MSARANTQVEAARTNFLLGCAIMLAPAALSLLWVLPYPPYVMIVLCLVGSFITAYLLPKKAPAPVPTRAKDPDPERDRRRILNAESVGLMELATAFRQLESSPETLWVPSGLHDHEVSVGRSLVSLDRHPLPPPKPAYGREHDQRAHRRGTPTGEPAAHRLE